MSDDFSQTVERVIRRQRTTCIVFFLFAAIAGGTVAATFIFDVDMLAGGGPSVLVGALICLTGLYAGILYRRRWQVALDLREQPWARWSYDDSTWKAYASDALEDDAGASIFGVLLIAVFALIAVGLVILFTGDTEAGIPLLLIMFAVVAVIGAAAWLSGLGLRRHLRSGPKLSILGSGGAIIGASFHAWDTPGARLESVTIADEADLPGMLFDYSFWSRGGRGHAQILIPIPGHAFMDAADLSRRYAEQSRG